MEQITLPSTIEFFDTDRPNVGEMVMSPCHQGYGTTLGNALRRVLLSSLPGSAVEYVKIDGVQHEFSAIDGVQEDVVEIILNLKQLAVRSFSDEPIVLSLNKKDKGAVTAGDFDKNSDVEIANPELVIANITEAKKELSMEITIGHGRGYVSTSQKETKNLDIGTIAIDSLYTPIRDVGYKVEMTRVGDVTNFEKLTLTIETNGTINPKEAVTQATEILMQHFALVLDSGPKVAEVVEEESVEVEENTEEATE